MDLIGFEDSLGLEAAYVERWKHLRVCLHNLHESKALCLYPWKPSTARVCSMQATIRESAGEFAVEECPNLSQSSEFMREVGSIYQKVLLYLG